MPDSKAADWQAHPIYIVAFGFSLGLWFDYQWLAPARLGDYRLEIADARNVVAKAEAEAKRQSNRAEGEERRADTLQKKLVEAERTARDAVTASSFVAGQPYPVGYGGIRIGMQLDQVEGLFSSEYIEKRKKGYWSIKLPSNIFRVTLYVDNRSPKQVVEFIYVWLDGDFSKDPEFLRSKLTVALGTPKEPAPGYYEWSLQDGNSVYMDGSENSSIAGRSYGVFRSGIRPQDWPSPITTGSIKR
jgi:hypothetical protein